MKVNIPAKIMETNVSTITPLDSWPYDDGKGDPWWEGGATPKPYQWLISGTVTEQLHGSHLTREEKRFNGLDIYVGDYIAGAADGIAVKVISIESKTETTFEMIVEDELRYNTFRSSTGTGIFNVPGDAYVFETNEDGDPSLDPLPFTIASVQFFPNLRSRFTLFRLQENFLLEKENNGFSAGDPIAMDSTTNDYELADTTNFDHLIGTVSASGPGPHEFLLRPSTKIVEDFEPAFPGEPGDFIYADPNVPGTYTTEQLGRELFLKMTNAIPTEKLGTESSPVLSIGDQLEINEFVVTMTGTTLADAANDINAHTSIHNVVATLVSPPVSITTTPSETDFGAPLFFRRSPEPSATINGVLVTFNDSTDGDANYATGMVTDLDMANTINSAGIPNITASSPGGLVSLTITNAIGGAITIVNVTSGSNSNGGPANIPFAGTTVPDGFKSASGIPLSTAATTDVLMQITRADGGEIILKDILGTPREDMGLYSVHNGRLPLGTVIEQGIRKGDVYVVADIAARDALTVLIGDQAHTLNKGDGEWGLFLYDGTMWTIVATEESARVDSRTLSATIDFNTGAVTVLGEVGPGVRVSPATIEVTSAFDGAPTISVGDSGDAARLFDDGSVDMSDPGSYTNTPIYQYPGPNDEVVMITFDAGGATTGSATVTITYS